MRNDFDSRFWAENHHRFTEDLGRFFAHLAAGYRRLQAIQYSAPWASASHPPQA
jgi:hypothetical protein